LSFDDNINDLRAKFDEIHPNTKFYEVTRRQGMLQFVKEFDAIDGNMTLRDAGVTHLSTWIALPEEFLYLANYVGENCDPARVHVHMNNEVTDIVINTGWTLSKLKDILTQGLAIDLNTNTLYKMSSVTKMRELDGSHDEE